MFLLWLVEVLVSRYWYTAVLSIFRLRHRGPGVLGLMLQINQVDWPFHRHQHAKQVRTFMVINRDKMTILDNLCIYVHLQVEECPASSKLLSLVLRIFHRNDFSCDFRLMQAEHAASGAFGRCFSRCLRGRKHNPRQFT